MDKIIVLDFGSQYSHLICRRIRELGIYCELLPCSISLHEIQQLSPKGIIFSGGPSSVYLDKSPKPDKEIFNLRIPILGICYGHQLIVNHFNGKVKRTSIREYGKADLLIDDDTDLFKNIGKSINCWMSHGDAAEQIPNNFRPIAHTVNSPSAAISNKERKIFGLQFHPEVVHTELGNEILKNFSEDICGAKKEWTMNDFVSNTINEIRSAVGNDKVLCAVSGGIDSTTVAAILKKSIGNNLVCIFVDNGLLRQDEEYLVKDLFKNHLDIDVISVNAKDRFMVKLRGVTDPEIKRKIIGEEFAYIFTESVTQFGPFSWLAQGTLYPDIIESGISKGPAAVIKTHHNVGGLPSWITLKLIEPLKMLYKDEVRKVARILEVPSELLERHPFPGPGLAVRIMGEVNEEKLQICKKSSKIVEDELRLAGLYNSVWQAYAAVGDDRAVGVIGDGRHYGHIVMIRVVDSTDAMTADWSKIPYNILERMSNRITNEVDNVTWVTYAISSKPPSTIEPQ